jgi:hypothetical protein
LITFKTPDAHSFCSRAVGLATGMLAAPSPWAVSSAWGMIYVLGARAGGSATELVIAFVMACWVHQLGLAGHGGHGWCVIQLAVASGRAIGAIGTPSAQHISRCHGRDHAGGGREPGHRRAKYLAKLGIMELSETTVWIMDKVSFVFMCAALLIGAVIILGSMWKGRRVTAEATESA